MALVLAGTQKDLRAALRSTSDFVLADSKGESQPKKLKILWEVLNGTPPSPRSASPTP
ncbi:hypothetical protein [Azospirillum sp. sgz301742]